METANEQNPKKASTDKARLKIKNGVAMYLQIALSKTRHSSKLPHYSFLRLTSVKTILLTVHSSFGYERKHLMFY